MRARLLSATIECLAERGYGAMSTNDVVRRARVSRGALAHHFPTKAELVRAAARELLAQRATQFRGRFTELAPVRRTPVEALNVLWSFYDDPGCVALLELTLAARHDPELRPLLADVPGQIAELTAEIFGEFFPQLAALPFVEEALRAIHALYTGLALGALADDETRKRGADVRAFLTVLVTAASQLAPGRSDPGSRTVPSLRVLASSPSVSPTATGELP